MKSDYYLCVCFLDKKLTTDETRYAYSEREREMKDLAPLDWAQAMVERVRHAKTWRVGKGILPTVTFKLQREEILGSWTVLNCDDGAAA